MSSGCHSFDCENNSCIPTIFNLQCVEVLSEQDYPARVKFCQWFLQQCDTNPNFPAFVIFTEEAQFTGDGIKNFHNQHLWADENPHAILPSHHQQQFSITSGPIFAVINYLDPIYFQTDLQGRIKKLSWKTTCLISCH
jgi:hypothetical protein